VVLGIVCEVYTAGGGFCGAWFVEGGARRGLRMFCGAELREGGGGRTGCEFAVRLVLGGLGDVQGNCLMGAGHGAGWNAVASMGRSCR